MLDWFLQFSDAINKQAGQNLMYALRLIVPRFSCQTRDVYTNKCHNGILK